MARISEYDVPVNRLKQALLKGFVVVVVSIFLVSYSSAQINGVPASVTSLGFGGHPGRITGVPPSVTSLGPRGFTPGRAQGPGFTPLFGVNAGNINEHHHHHNNGVIFPWGGYYTVPYYGYYDSSSDTYDQEQPQDQYNGGPTMFDRRGPGTAANVPSPYSDNSSNTNRNNPDQQSAALPAPEPPPASDQPKTVLVFKDGHQVEVANYAIVGNTLYNFEDGLRHKIALADLDLTATSKQNEDRGIDFQLPAGVEAN